MKQYAPKVGTDMQEFCNGGWIPYTETLFDAKDYPGLQYYLEEYDKVNKKRRDVGLPIWTFETYMRKRIADDELEPIVKGVIHAEEVRATAKA